MSAASFFGRLQASSSARAPIGGFTGPALAVAGVALLATGSVAVFVSTNTTGTAALVAAGLALVAIAALGERIESLEAAGMKLTLQAASTLAAAEQAEASGDSDRAERLRQDAAKLLDAARAAGQKYEKIRATQASSWERTAQLEDLMRQTSQLADSYPAQAASDLFSSGTDGNRAIALGLMATNAALADPGAIADAIVNSRSAFEQYHALRAAESLANLEARGPGADAVRDAVQQALSSHRVQDDSGRRQLAQRVLELLT